MVPVNVADRETTVGVQGNDGTELVGNGGLLAVGDRSRGPKLDARGDGVDERLPLEEEKIDTKDDVLIMFLHTWRNGDKVETWDTSGFTSARRLSLECGHLWPIDDCRALGVGGSHWPANS